MTQQLVRVFAAALSVVLLAAPAAAQQTGRGDDPSAVPADQPTPTAQATDTPDTGFVARIKGYINKQRDAREKVTEPDGFYPRIGGLTTGSGLTLGGGYRTHFVDRAYYADLSGVISTKWYIGLDGRLRLPSPAPEWLEFWTSAAFRRFTQEDYFGLGDASREADRANYALHSLDVGGQAVVRLAPWLRVGTDIGYFMPTIRPGTDPKWPSIEHQFTDVSAPGLFEQPDFLHLGVFTTADTRDERGNAHSGGLYRATLARWNDRGVEGYAFNRFDADANHYVPIGLRHVLVGRVGLSYVNNDSGERVPFYVYPYVGGANTIRSYDEFRFRDENAFFLSGEYRFGVGKYVQLVGFVDGGKVARNWEDINLRDLKTGYGAGVRAGTETRTFVRVDFGTGGESNHLYIKFFPTF